MTSIFMKVDRAYASLPQGWRKNARKMWWYVFRSGMVNFFRPLAGKGKLIFDIGANIGDYADIFSELSAKTICVEPQSECVKILQEKFGNSKKIEIIHAGVGKAPGVLELNISSVNHPNSTFSKEFVKNSRYSDLPWDKKEKVKIITLRQMIKKYGVPDFCKIDVEGFEWEVISTLDKPIPCISFEILNETKEITYKIIRFLDKLGHYEYNLAEAMKMEMGNERWVSGKEMIEMVKSNQLDSLTGDVYARTVKR